MKKYIIILLLFLLPLLTPKHVFSSCTVTCDQMSAYCQAINNCPEGTVCEYTPQEAYQAMQYAWGFFYNYAYMNLTPGETGNPTTSGGPYTNTSDTYNCYALWVQDPPEINPNGNWDWYGAFYFCTEPFDNEFSDSDCDGLPDSCDNCPAVYNPDQIDMDEDGIGFLCDEDEEFMWKLFSYQKDSQGNYTYVKIFFDDDSVWVYGEYDPDKLDYVSVGAPWQPAADLPPFLETLGLAGDGYESGGDAGNQNDSTSLDVDWGDSTVSDEITSTDVGDGVTGGSTDSELLSNIEANTATQADNDQDAQDILTDVVNALNNSTDIYQKGTELLLETIEDLPTASEIANATEEAQEQAGDAEAITQNAYLNGVGDGVYEGYNVEEDVPDTEGSQTSYETAIADLQSNSDLSSVAGQVGIELSGSVSSVSCNVWGQDISFDFGKYDNIYSALGVAWLSLCYLFGFFLIVRG